jgi:phytoene dehydrogenase-like protein
LPPSLAHAAVHASVAAHYFGGGFYPRGGGFAIPKAFVRALRRAGGEIRLGISVERILMEDGRAIGVRLADGTEVRANDVVSNADPHVTFDRLIGREHLGRRFRWQLDRTRYSVSAISLFLATDLDARAAGLDSGNYWYYASDDIEGIYRRGMTPWSTSGDGLGELPGLFLTVSTLKDPSKLHKGHHTMEAFTFVGYDAFKQWAASRYGERPDSYERLKRELGSRMLEAAARIVPGLDGRVVFSSLGTPLTNVHYCAATRGNLYGTEKSLLQVGPFGWGVRSPIPGLSLCGASTLGHGVFGATLSGLVVARNLLGCRTSELLGQRGPSLAILPSEHPELWPAPLRARIARGREREETAVA